jgi:hypothetical protein
MPDRSVGMLNAMTMTAKITGSSSNFSKAKKEDHVN